MIMKNKFIKNIGVALLLAGSLTGCINDDDYGNPLADCVEPSLTANKTVAQIVAASTAGLQQYTANDVIEAYVNSSDERGNFFKVVYLQTIPANGAAPVGFSINIDKGTLFGEGFYPGRKIYISLKDLYYAKTDGALELGALYQGAVGRIAESDYKKYLFPSCSEVGEDQLVRQMSITEAKTDANLNTLIELTGVQFDSEFVGGTYFDAEDTDNTAGGATNRLLKDAGGKSIIFRTSSFANFSGNVIPEKSGTVRGVLTKFGSAYQFVARSGDDIKLTQDRIGGDIIITPGAPFYTEDFEDAVDNTNFNFPGWANILESGSRKWSEQTFTPPGGVSNGYAELSAFGTNNPLNVAWLVTPAIDMDGHTGESFSFDAAQHHLDADADGNKLEVFILTSFDGTNINSATKVDVTGFANLPTTDNEWYEFVNSGNINLSAYTGQIYIAFKFTGSGTDTTFDGAFQVDNLIISGN